MDDVNKFCPMPGYVLVAPPSSQSRDIVDITIGTILKMANAIHCGPRLDVGDRVGFYNREISSILLSDSPYYVVPISAIIGRIE